MKFSTIIKHSAELVRIIFNSSTPADTLASEYLRSKKYIGSNDRKLISEIVFSNLRTHTLSQKAVAEFLYENKINDVPTDKINYLELLTTIIIYGDFDAKYFTDLKNNLSKINILYNELIELVTEVISELEINFINSVDFMKYQIDFAHKFMEKIRSNNPMQTVDLCISRTVLDSLSKKYNNSFINNLAVKLMHPAPLCVRVNTLISSVEEVFNELINNDIRAYKSQLSPAGIIISDRVNLSNYEFFKNGSVEVQDIGSQLISYALNPDESSNILDACAGAGGKTLHIAVLSKDNSQITAVDTEYKRLKEIEIRADKAGIRSIQSILIRNNDLGLKIKQNFDSILIDAPCSGLGTVRRMPMQKYRLNDKLLHRITTNQYKILEYYSQFLAIDGNLVYATCSILPDENEDIINKFLDVHKEFEAVPLKPSFDSFNIEIPELKYSDYCLALTPLNDETDGFFMAKIKRIN